MLIVDASCLYEVVIGSTLAEQVRRYFDTDPDRAAPHVVDAEVLGLIRRDRLRGRLDETAAQQAVDDLQGWPGERFGHQALIPRAWELRQNVRTWDALYVALAEALDGTLLTFDQRLGRASGLLCSVEVLVRPQTIGRTST